MKDAQIILTLDQPIQSGELYEFEIAGPDGKFANAEATANGNTIVVKAAANSCVPSVASEQSSSASLFTLHSSLKNELQLDLTLARGLNYYTGAIFEVKALDVQIGSITGGGRYDNLTGIFGMPGISGVGISFGVDRIFDVLNALDCYPQDAVVGTQLLFVNFGEKETAYCMPAVSKAREAGIRTEIYPDSAKMKKQMSYANAKQIPFVAMAGENEMAEGKLNLKNMITGEQQLVTIEELIVSIK